MLRRLIQRLKRGSYAERANQRRGERLNRSSAAPGPSGLFPIVVPIEFSEVGWPGPIEQIGNLPLALVWGVLGEMNCLVYVNHKQAQVWESAGLDWQALGFRNLQEASQPGATSEKCDEEERPFVKVMLHDDGMGPSRLLVPHLFDDELGTGHKVAIPERSCALAYRKDLTDAQRADVDGMINGCFEHGREPVSQKRYDASDFWAVAERYGMRAF